MGSPGDGGGVDGDGNMGADPEPERRGCRPGGDDFVHLARIGRTAVDDRHPVLVSEHPVAARHQFHAGQQDGVEAINGIFREEDIGYEFSPYVVTQTSLGSHGGGESYQCEIQYPEATPRPLFLGCRV